MTSRGSHWHRGASPVYSSYVNHWHMLHLPTPWRNTLGMLLVVQSGSLREKPEQAGWTHIAEHLMFSGTDKLLYKELQQHIDHDFQLLEASTSHNDMRLFAVWEAGKTDTCLPLVDDMLHRWQCRKADWPWQKQMLRDELGRWYADGEQQRRAWRVGMLPIAQQEVIGTRKQLQLLKHSDLPALQAYWAEMLASCPAQLVLVGPWTPEQKAKVAAWEKPAPAPKAATLPVYQESEHIGALVWQGRPHLYQAIMERVWDRRYYRDLRDWYWLDFMRYGSHWICALTTNGRFRGSKSYGSGRPYAEKLFCTAPTTEELKQAIDDLQAQMRAMQDLAMDDHIDAFRWWAGWPQLQYDGMDTSSAESIAATIESLDAQRVLSWWREWAREVRVPSA